MSFELTTTAPQSQEMGMASDAARAEAETKAMVVMAIQYPRDEGKAVARLGNSLGRLSFAEKACYSFPRSKTTVTGPSVVLAREIARLWGNITYGFRVTTDNSDTRALVAWAYDLETNTRVEQGTSFGKKVQRKSWNDQTRQSTTTWVVADERELRELTNKHGAICVRNCLLQLIPSDIIEDSQAIAKRTMLDAEKAKTKGNKSEIKKAIDTAVKGFETLGCTLQMLEIHMEKPVDQWDEETIVDLKNLASAVKDGYLPKSELIIAEDKKTSVNIMDAIAGMRESKQ